MAFLLDAEVVGDRFSSMAMVRALFAKLEPAPMSGWLIGFAMPVAKQGSMQTFASESDPKGDPWAALAPSTIEDRINQGYGAGPIQQRTGELHSYFAEAEAAITATTIGVSMQWPGNAPSGDRLPYKVGSAQAGNRRTGAPPRPILGLTLQDGAVITERLFLYLMSGTLV